MEMANDGLAQEIKQNRRDGVFPLGNAWCVDGEKGLYPTREEAKEVANLVRSKQHYTLHLLAGQNESSL